MKMNKRIKQSIELQEAKMREVKNKEELTKFKEKYDKHCEENAEQITKKWNYAHDTFSLLEMSDFAKKNNYDIQSIYSQIFKDAYGK